MIRSTGLLILLSGLLFQSPSIAATPAHTWSKGFVGFGEKYANDVAVDGAGNVYMVGSFNATVGFGGAALTHVGGFDIFLAKFDIMGQHLWSKRFGGSSDDEAIKVETDAAGDVYVAGTYYGSTDLGDGNIPNQGGADVFIAKYSADGALQWKHTGGSAGDQVPMSIALDASGNVYLAGHFANSLDLGGGLMASAGDRDMYVVKYTSSGAFLWQQRFGDSGYQAMYNITADVMDNLYLIGVFAGTINFGAGNMTSIGSANLALAKFNSSGQCQWSKRFGLGARLDEGYVATDSAGNLYITGAYLCCLDFGGGFMFENGGLDDIYLAKFDASGNHLWSKDYGDNNTDLVRGLAIDANDNLYLYGMFRGTVDFGGGPIPEDSTSFWTPFLAEIDAFGNHIWSRRFQAEFLDPQGLSVNARGICFGGSGANVDLGGGTLPFVSGVDAYLARFSEQPIPAGITSITDVPGDQGRQVSIQFSPSGYDAPGGTAITRYELFRKRDALADKSPAAGAAPGAIALQDWVHAGTVSASGQDGYVTAAPTLVDSTVAQGQHYSTFFVRAATANPLTYFDSPPADGYSVDNVAPPAPTGFAFQNSALSWDLSSAADFDYFTVYGSSTSAFGSATIVDYTTGASMDVTASPYAYYFVTATDFSGNESQPAALATPTAVDGSPKYFALSISAYPNPFNPQTTIRYTVPARGRVAINLFDARGSHVATLFDGVREIGAFTLGWNGEDNTGQRLSSGVYFARVTQASQTRSYKLVLLK